MLDVFPILRTYSVGCLGRSQVVNIVTEDLVENTKDVIVGHVILSLQSTARLVRPTFVSTRVSVWSLSSRITAKASFDASL